MRINLHIERIVVDGLPVDRRGAEAMRQALQGELTRLFTDEGIPPSLHADTALNALRTPSIAFTKNTTPVAIGQQIANSVHGGLQ
jgi:hypothetical protein